ncbi:hypothetical protein PC116_g7344 [Phytophthora cactorum]|nr:hypothetical protein PC114_g13502 [Phytophthora cactorum]KAG2914000.1 hypothetical protein PC115_g11828 [Phytophthora cactorum]KAG2978457.1 hypothetical protein PC118_g12281 [Phytophthora cactorum]KAG4244875.1 hypothetical protein PC116_g7344 [Phytophthora cactorum]
MFFTTLMLWIALSTLILLRNILDHIEDIGGVVEDELDALNPSLKTSVVAPMYGTLTMHRMR